MLISLVKITKNSYNDYSLANIYINPLHIVFMCEAESYKTALLENKINLDLDKNIEFTKIKLSDAALHEEVVVVGSPTSIQGKMHTQKKILLRD